MEGQAVSRWGDAAIAQKGAQLTADKMRHALTPRRHLVWILATLDIAQLSDRQQRLSGLKSNTNCVRNESSFGFKGLKFA
jgi:hypothetical protein